MAALGASSYTFACAAPHETMADWLRGCPRALSFIGGVPQLIVPDNPRAIIANPNRYEPRVNETVEDFARHGRRASCSSFASKASVQAPNVCDRAFDARGCARCTAGLT